MVREESPTIIGSTPCQYCSITIHHLWIFSPLCNWNNHKPLMLHIKVPLYHLHLHMNFPLYQNMVYHNMKKKNNNDLQEKQVSRFYCVYISSLQNQIMITLRRIENQIPFWKVNISIIQLVFFLLMFSKQLKHLVRDKDNQSFLYPFQYLRQHDLYA